jgi:MFS family permease
LRVRDGRIRKIAAVFIFQFAFPSRSNCAFAVLKTLVGWAEYSELAALFFFQAMATSMWLVPLGRILDAQGFGSLSPYAYGTFALSAFFSPLIFGAMADRHTAPSKVMRWLAAVSGLTLLPTTLSIQQHWPVGTVLLLLQLYAITASPTTSLAATIVFSRLRDSQRQFGPLRAVATFGWMCGCWLISGINLDSSASAGYVVALGWFVLAAITLLLPNVAPPPGAPMTFRQRMGWDALVLLKHHDHRVVFLTVALFCIPIAAFYPYTPAHLQQLGFQRTTAWMSLGQITEIISMFCLAGLFARLRLNWIFIGGLSFGILRFALCALNGKAWLLAGITLHGFSFTLVFVTAQIYLNERIDSVWRARAQALMSLMTSGFGNLAGYLGTGYWLRVCSQAGATRWPLYWSGLAVAVAAVFLFFLVAYHGKSTGFRRTSS